MARIVVDHLRAGVVQHVIVLDVEVFPGSFRDDRFHLADDNPLNAGVQNERARSHSCTETHDQRRTRLAADQRRKVAQHTLQAHVGRKRGSLHLTADVKLDRAIAVPSRDCDG